MKNKSIYKDPDFLELQDDFINASQKADMAREARNNLIRLKKAQMSFNSASKDKNQQSLF